MSKQSRPDKDRDNCYRYAVAVVDTLAGDFPDLRQDTTAEIARDHIFRNAISSCGIGFIVDNPVSARWRLKPSISDRRRVRLACWNQRPLSAADREREARLNATLDELEIEEK